jgi:N-methylhydantoinase B
MKNQPIQIGEKLRIEQKDGRTCYICVCGQDLGLGRENFKDSCRMQETMAADMGSGYEAYDREMADRMCFREFFCPSCGTRHATEMARIGDPILWDIMIDV